MKKSFVMLPLVALALTACSSKTNPDVQPAEVVSIPAPAWQAPDIQPVQMPNAMTQPTYPMPQAVQTPQPVPSHQTPKPSVYQAPVPAYQVVQPMPQAQHSPFGQVNQIGACRIVRDAANTPDYKQMQKGCYTDATYTVNKGDTIFFISFLAGKPFAEIAKLNNLVEPYPLKMGQVLRLR